MPLRIRRAPLQGRPRSVVSSGLPTAGCWAPTQATPAAWDECTRFFRRQARARPCHTPVTELQRPPFGVRPREPGGCRRRLITMRHGTLLAVGAAVMAMVTAGCGTGAAGSAAQTHGPPTRVLVAYQVGPVTRRQAALAGHCPTLARCRPIVVGKDRGRALWMLRATHQAGVRPGGGQLPPSRARMRGTPGLRRPRPSPAGSRLRSPLQIGRPSVVTGDLRGQAVTLNIGVCAACGLGAQRAATCTC